MEKSTILKKEQRLKELEEQLKKEKHKINEKLGKSIIEFLKFGYDEIDSNKINEICHILDSYYHKKDNE